MAKKEESRLARKFACAVKDPELLTRGVVENMRLYSMSYLRMKRAMRTAYWQTARNKKALADIRKTKMLASLMGKLRRAEENYPGILWECIKSGNMADVGRKFSISRQRVHQIIEEMFDYSIFVGKPVKAVIDEASDKPMGR